MEYVKDRSAYDWWDFDAEKIAKFLNINFDMRDIAESTNILEEYVEEYLEDMSTYPQNLTQFLFFGQANNDGKLFIDINLEDGKEEFKYAFLDDECNTDYIMDPNSYMNWEQSYIHYSHWTDDDWAVPNKCFTDEDIKICKENIEFIKETGQLMTITDLMNFIEYDYTEFVNLPNANKWLLKLKRDENHLYTASFVAAGKTIQDLPVNSSYYEIKKAIFSKTGIVIPKIKELSFKAFNKNEYSFIKSDYGTISNVTIEEIIEQYT
jgi:hypothetical protein